MQAIVGLADNAAASSVPGSILMPSPLSFAIHLMNRMHWIWRWHFMVTEVYANTANLKKLIAGHVLHYVVGDVTIIRIAAQVVMIAVRIIVLGKQKVFTYTVYLEVYHAVAGTYPLRVRVRLPKAGDSWVLDILGPDHYLWAAKKKEAFLLYTGRIIRCVAQLFQEMLKVSMCYMDVIEAFSLNSATRDEAVNHFFLNSTRLLDEIAENKQTIHAELLRHKYLIQQILSGLGTPCQAEQLISAVASTLTPVERTYNAAKVLYDHGEDFIKQGLSTLALSLGWQPGVLLPKDRNPIGPLVAGAA